MNNLRFAFRQLLKSPGFTAVAVLTLALGIGANTAIFGVLNELLLRPLPVKEPEKLWGIVLTDDTGDFAGQNIPYPIVKEYSEQSGGILEQFAAYASTFAPAEIDGTSQLASLELTTAGYFSTLGVTPALGRWFGDSDDRHSGQGAVAVLSHAAWQRWFGGDPDVLGKTISLRPAYVDPVHCTVIGIAPPHFEGLGRSTPQIWLPAVTERFFKDAAQINFRLIGRLAKDVSHRQAESALDVVAATVAAKHGGRVIPGYENEGIFRSNLHTELRYAALGSWGAFRPLAPLRRARLLAFGVAGLVLLIACANIGNLLLARGERRRKEVAIRISLGASRSRILRYTLMESLLLSSLGGGAGLLLAHAGNRILMVLKPQDVELLVKSQLDLRVAGFCLLAAGISGLIVGLVPAWRSSREDPNLALKSHVEDPHVGGFRVLDAFVVAQVALSMVLLIAAGLCLRSFALLVTSNPGFKADDLLVARLDFRNVPESSGPAHYRALVERLTAMPVVESVSWSRVFPMLPLSGSMSMPVDQIEGYERQPEEFLSVEFTEVATGYFETMGMSVASAPDHRLEGVGSMVWVNEAFVRRYCPDLNPIGKRVGPWIVEGVVKDSRVNNLWDPIQPYLYYQTADPDARSGVFIVRTNQDSRTVLPQIRAELLAMDSELDLSRFISMREALGQTLSSQRFMVALLGLFAGCSVALAVIGIYGVMSYLVNLRRREIGIRLALGAQRRQILFAILHRGSLLTAAGLLMGLGGSWAATRLLQSALFGVSPTDAATFGCVTLILAGAALFSCWLPARRGAMLDPMEALRSE